MVFIVLYSFMTFNRRMEGAGWQLKMMQSFFQNYYNKEKAAFAPLPPWWLSEKKEKNTLQSWNKHNSFGAQNNYWNCSSLCYCKAILQRNSRLVQDYTHWDYALRNFKSHFSAANYIVYYSRGLQSLDCTKHLRYILCYRIIDTVAHQSSPDDQWLVSLIHPSLAQRPFKQWNIHIWGKKHLAE